MKYRKKPAIVEAFRFYDDPMPQWFYDKMKLNEIATYSDDDGENALCEIKTLEGLMTAYEGDSLSEV